MPARSRRWSVPQLPSMQYDSNHPPNTTMTFEPATLSAFRRIQKSAIPVYRNFNSLAAFSLMISARTSSLIGSFSNSASQRSG